MSRLRGKVAVVTGASKGIGAAIAKALGNEGAAVAVNYRSDEAGATAVVREIIAAGGKAQAFQADVGKAAEVQKLFSNVNTAFGKVDILVNNAGVYEMAPIEQFSEESYRRMFDTNVLGTLLATHEVAKYVNGGGASIINVSSIASLTPLPGGSVYGATKGAVDVITKALARELGARNIRVNSLSPGLVETEGVRAMTGGNVQESEFAKIAVAHTPLGRVGTPEDIAKAAVFLASDDAQWITGEIIPVAGGARV